MPSLSDLLTRVRTLLAGGAAVVALGSGWYLVGPETADAPVIRVAAFNIQVFGKTKAGKADVMEVLAQIAREFDVLVVQEIRDATETVADRFLDEINGTPGPRYAMFESARLGRTASKEQYVVYYVPARVELLDAFVQPDPDDEFEREPIIATFRSGNFDFTLVAVHIKPTDADNELAALVDVVGTLLTDRPDEQDVILLGDFNADCRYLDEDDLTHDLRGPGFHWAIENDMVTTTTGSGCTYDRIILRDATLSEYAVGSAQVFYFDQEYGLTDQDFVRSISDHYPVYAEFATTSADDDP